MRFFAIASLVFTAATSVFAGAVVQRGSTPPGVASILTTLNNNVASYTDQLKSLSADEVTENNVEPATNGINSVVQTALSNLKALQGQPTDVIMASANGDGTVSADDVSTLLGDGIEDILGAIGEIIEVVDDELIPDVVELLTDVGEIVDELLSDVGELVTGVLDLVDGVLYAVADVIDDLGLTELYDTTVGYSISS